MDCCCCFSRQQSAVQCRCSSLHAMMMISIMTNNGSSVRYLFSDKQCFQIKDRFLKLHALTILLRIHWSRSFWFSGWFSLEQRKDSTNASSSCWCGPSNRFLQPLVKWVSTLQVEHQGRRSKALTEGLLEAYPCLQIVEMKLKLIAMFAFYLKVHHVYYLKWT